VDVSRVAPYLAARLSVLCAFLVRASVPGVFGVRSSVRGCEEGRLRFLDAGI